MFGGEIQKRVMAVVKEKIQEAQQKYEVTKKELEDKCFEDIKALNAKLATDVEMTADNLVNDITKKFL